jgi:hypothetical protein
MVIPFPFGKAAVKKPFTRERSQLILPDAFGASSRRPKKAEVFLYVCV